MTNDDIIARLRSLRPGVLLVPFHAMRDRRAERTSGLDLVRRVREELPELRDVPVVMPVSVFGQLAFDAAWRQHRPEGVVPILETALDEDALLPVLRHALRSAAIC